MGQRNQKKGIDFAEIKKQTISSIEIDRAVMQEIAVKAGKSVASGPKQLPKKGILYSKERASVLILATFLLTFSNSSVKVVIKGSVK